MRLPVIKHINAFIQEHDSDFVSESVQLLEHLSESKGIKDEELDVIGELISNMYGALEVQKLIQEGQTEREALNNFMQRVLGSVDK
jgi:hypothetical protein